MGPTNGIVGDQNFGTDLPETLVDESQVMVEKGMAKFSKSKEYQKLKEHLEQRISFYQNFLPDGRAVTEDASAQNWIIANTVIGEFKAILQAYETAAEAVKEASAR